MEYRFIRKMRSRAEKILSVAIIVVAVALITTAIENSQETIWNQPETWTMAVICIVLSVFRASLPKRFGEDMDFFVHTEKNEFNVICFSFDNLVIRLNAEKCRIEEYENHILVYDDRCMVKVPFDDELKKLLIENIRGDKNEKRVYRS